MTAKNDITGDLIKTKANSAAYCKNITSIFGDKPVQRGRFKWCGEEKDFIPINEWNKKYGTVIRKGPMIICNHFEAFQSTEFNKSFLVDGQ